MQCPGVTNMKWQAACERTDAVSCPCISVISWWHRAWYAACASVKSSRQRRCCA